MKKNCTNSKLKNYPIAPIEWEDAKVVAQGPWEGEQNEYAYTPYVVHTVAFVLHHCKEGIVFTDSLGEGLTGSVHQIPSKMIKKLTILGQQEMK